VPKVKVIKFIRQNTLKTAVSGMRGTQTHTVCGQSNTRGSSKDCLIPHTLNVTVKDLLRQVSTWQVRFYCYKCKGFIGSLFCPFDALLLTLESIFTLFLSVSAEFIIPNHNLII
jgi:hypothetical protein